MQILPYWFKEKLSPCLHEIGEVYLIKGHQVKWRQYCEGHDMMMQVVKCLCIPPEIRKHVVSFTCTVATCSIKPRLLGKRLNVMLSGFLDGYRSWSDFAAEMNRKYGNVVQMVGVGKRKAEAVFLVKGIYATDHEKSAIANAMGIPTITPKSLDEKLVVHKSYITEGRKGS